MPLQEPLPEPTPAELAKEAEQEAAVFAQAVNVERLLNMLRALDPAKDNLTDNEEIQVSFLFFFSFLLSPFITIVCSLVSFILPSVCHLAIGMHIRVENCQEPQGVLLDW